MKKRLSRISLLQLGVVLAVFYGLLSLIIIVPMGALSAVFWASCHAVGSDPSFHAPAGSCPPPSGILGGFMMILMPILYAVMGFVLGIISGAVYNLVAKWTGGIEFTVTDAPES